MTAWNDRSGGGCIPPELLLRRHFGYSPDEERQRVDAHAESCQACHRDLASLQEVAIDLMVAQADRNDLEQFQPDRAHAQVCLSMGPRRLRGLANSKEPLDPKVQDHFDSCVYCRQRLLQTVRGDEGTETLCSMLLSTLLEPALAQAGEAVAVAAAWDPVGSVRKLAQRLCVWMDDTGNVLADGLDALLGRAPYALAAAAAMDEVEAPDQQWQVPLPEVDMELQIGVRAAGQHEEGWVVRLRLEGPVPGEAAQPGTLRIDRIQGLPLIDGPLADFLNRPLTLSDGPWQIVIEIAGNEYVIPLELKAP